MIIYCSDLFIACANPCTSGKISTSNYTVLHPSNEAFKEYVKCFAYFASRRTYRKRRHANRGTGCKDARFR